MPSARTFQLPAVLAPFRVASFRFQWPSDLLTSWAFEMETLILGWYVLVETKSVLLLTVFGALQFVGTLLSPMIGMLGDRLGHRNVYCMMRATYMTVGGDPDRDRLRWPRDASRRARHLPRCAGWCGPPISPYARPWWPKPCRPIACSARMGIARTTSDLARIGGALAGAGLFAALGIAQAYVCRDRLLRPQSVADVRHPNRGWIGFAD